MYISFSFHKTLLMNMEFNIGKNRIETTGQTHTLTTVPTVTFTAKHKHRQTNEPPHLQNN